MYEKKSIYVKIVRGIPMPCSVNYTYKRPLRGHCAPPLQKPSQSVCTFGLTSWGFMVKRVRKRAATKCFRTMSRLLPFLKNGRDDRIRTCDLIVPNDALYQAEPHPDNSIYYTMRL